MKKMRFVLALSFLFSLTLTGLYGQKRDDSPAGVAKRGTDFVKSVVTIDSVTAVNVYNCYLTHWTAFDLKKKEGKPMAGQFEQTRLTIDSCLRKILTKSQYEKWSVEEEKNNYWKHDSKK
jgi:hypothetical protein